MTYTKCYTVTTETSATQETNRGSGRISEPDLFRCGSHRNGSRDNGHKRYTRRGSYSTWVEGKGDRKRRAATRVASATGHSNLIAPTLYSQKTALVERQILAETDLSTKIPDYFVPRERS